MAKAESYFGKVLMPEKAVKRKIKAREKKKALSFGMYRQMIVLCAEGFLMGRINFFNALNPVGIAFLASCMGKGAVFYPAALSVFMGYVTGSRFFGDYGYWVSVACCTALAFMYDGNTKMTETKQAFFGGISLFAGGAVVAAVNGFSTFLFVRALAESIAVFGLTMVFCRSVKLMGTDFKRKLLSTDEAVCLAIPVILAIASFGSVSAFPLKMLLSVYFILSVSFALGASAGGAAGVILGFALIMCGQADSTFLCVLSFGGIMCGLFGRKSKTAAVIAFAVSSSVPAFYMGLEQNVQNGIMAVLGALLFMAAPKSFYDMFSVFSSGKKEFDENKYYIKVKEYTEEKIRSLAESFGALAEIFGSRKIAEETITPKSSAIIIDMAADRVCSSCGLGVYCWKGRTLETYGAVYAMINDFEENGTVSTSSVPQSFGKSCVKLNQLAEAVNSCCREYKTSEMWKKRLDDSRFIIREQLEEMKDIINETKGNINFRPYFDESVAKEIREKLAKNGCEVSFVSVVTDDEGKTKVTVESSDCGGRERCKNIYAHEVSSVCGKTMVMTDKNCSAERCVSVFEEENAFNCSFVHCLAVCGNGDVTGDNFEAKKFRSDVFTAAVSDGMGSGEKASKQSKAVLEKLSRLLAKGIDEETAVKAVNCSMIGEYDESFATLDVLSIDLKNGKGRIIKNGGASVFVIRGGEVIGIKSTSLPLGIKCRAESEVTKFELRDKDVVLMITDGISDAIKGENEEKLIEKMAKEMGNIKSLCSEIINYAVRKDGGVPKDDMLALAVKIYEN